MRKMVGLTKNIDRLYLYHKALEFGFLPNELIAISNTEGYRYIFHSVSATEHLSVIYTFAPPKGGFFIANGSKVVQR